MFDPTEFFRQINLTFGNFVKQEEIIDVEFRVIEPEEIKELPREEAPKN